MRGSTGWCCFSICKSTEAQRSITEDERKGNRLVQYVPDYTVFDLETTGISANMDDIIEISAVKVKGGIVQDTFSTLVNPGRHIPAQATKVNGITDQMVSEAPLIREAMTEFLRFVRRGYSGGT